MEESWNRAPRVEGVCNQQGCTGADWMLSCTRTSALQSHFITLPPLTPTPPSPTSTCPKLTLRLQVKQRFSGKHT